MYVASLLTVATFVASWFLRLPGYAPLRVAGLGCGLAAIILMFSPMYLLKKHGDVPPNRNYMQTTIVIDHGPFALIRHPQYLGYALFCITFALLAQHWVVAGLGVGAAACFYRYAVEEERFLVARFGDIYQEYMARVPRFNILLGIWRALSK
jgi:protein-S-isoprenylcysteine O-methyltransferase Ste14